MRKKSLNFKSTKRLNDFFFNEIIGKTFSIFLLKTGKLNKQFFKIYYLGLDKESKQTNQFVVGVGGKLCHSHHKSNN